MFLYGRANNSNTSSDPTPTEIMSPQSSAENEAGRQGQWRRFAEVGNAIVSTTTTILVMPWTVGNAQASSRMPLIVGFEWDRTRACCLRCCGTLLLIVVDLSNCFLILALPCLSIHRCLRFSCICHFGWKVSGNSTSVFPSQLFDQNRWIRLIATVSNEQYSLYVVNNVFYRTLWTVLFILLLCASDFLAEKIEDPDPQKSREISACDVTKPFLPI
jgi:hypothetical protein